VPCSSVHLDDRVDEDAARNDPFGVQPAAAVDFVDLGDGAPAARATGRPVALSRREGLTPT